MGVVKKYKCSCGYEVQLYTGSGLNSANKALVEKMFPKESKVYKKLYLEEVIAYCEECKELKNTGALVITEGEKRKYILKECTVCGREMTHIKDEVRCPKCKKIMIYEDIGIWD